MLVHAMNNAGYVNFQSDQETFRKFIEIPVNPSLVFTIEYI